LTLSQNWYDNPPVKIVTYSETRANLKAIQETMYLLSTPNNVRRLMESIANIEAGKNLVHVDPETMQPL
jgi:hypothetical protein